MGENVIIRFWWESVSRDRLHPETISPFLQIFRTLRMFKIVFRDSSLYPKQLLCFVCYG